MKWGGSRATREERREKCISEGGSKKSENGSIWAPQWGVPVSVEVHSGFLGRGQTRRLQEGGIIGVCIRGTLECLIVGKERRRSAKLEARGEMTRICHKEKEIPQFSQKGQVKNWGGVEGAAGWVKERRGE